MQKLQPVRTEDRNMLVAVLLTTPVAALHLHSRSEHLLARRLSASHLRRSAGQPGMIDSPSRPPPTPLPLAPPLPVWLQQAGAMWVSAALLGPLCDGRHSAHDVLHYNPNSMAGPPWLLEAPGGAPLLETCWWVPVAFGGAGVVLGVAHPLLDRRWGGGPRPPPGWPTVLVSISCFVLCYELSGVLAQAAAASGGAHDYVGLDLPLLLCAAAIFVGFERSWGGLLMMALLATIGPVAEIGLINQLHLYAYTHPDFAGIPSWITWVYAAGGPANGALGRQLLHELEEARGK